MPKRETNMLRCEIDDFISLQTSTFTDRWESANFQHGHSFLECLSTSTCASYVLIALSAISSQYHRRISKPENLQHMSSVFYGVFTREVHQQLDALLYANVFSDTAHIDQCYEDNWNANDFEFLIKDLRFILKGCKPNSENYPSAFISTLPVDWFDRSYRMQNGIIEYCIASAVRTCQATISDGQYTSLGPPQVIASLIVNIICEEILKNESVLNCLVVADTRISGQFSIFQRLLSKFSNNDIDHMLCDPENTF